jgi:Leucine Rich Repeat
LAQFAHLKTKAQQQQQQQQLQLPPPAPAIPSMIDLHSGHDFLNISTLDTEDGFLNELAPHAQVQPGLSYIQGPYVPRPFPAGLGVPPPPPAAAAPPLPLQPQNDSLEFSRQPPPPPTAPALAAPDGAPPVLLPQGNPADDASFSIAVQQEGGGNPSISQLTTPASQLEEASQLSPSLPLSSSSQQQQPPLSLQPPSLIVEEPPYKDTKDASFEPKWSRRKWWILGGAAAVLIIVIVAVVTSTQSSSHSPATLSKQVSSSSTNAAAPMAPAASGPAPNSPTLATAQPSTLDSNRDQAIVNFINNITLTGRTIARLVPGKEGISAEDRALEWIIASDSERWTVGSRATEFRWTQRYALATLWIQDVSEDGWAGQLDECQWPGNSCTEMDLGSEIGMQQAVTGMELENMGLSGSLSSDLGLLSNLVMFDVYNNSFGGTIPSTLARWTNITVMDLRDNDLTGTVPEDVCELAAESNALRVDCPEVACECCAECNAAPVATLGTTEPMPPTPTAPPTRTAPEALSVPVPPTVSPVLPITTTSPSMASASNEIAYRAASIVNFINSITLSGRGIANPTTSTEQLATEERAVQWLIVNDPLQLTPDTTINQFRLHQRYALLTLMVQQGWESQWTQSSNDNHECEWTEIACAEGDFGGDIGIQRVVVGISLSRSALQGSIPADLGLLFKLQVLDVSYNSLGGSLPDSIGNWLDLQQFLVNDNRLTGTIPESIASWSQIKFIRLGSNQFTGSVPEGICGVRFSYLGADCISEVTCSCCTVCSDLIGF